MTQRRLIHLVPSNRWGGVQTYCRDICRYYHDQGWDVAAMTRNAIAIDTVFEKAGIRLLHAPMRGFFDLRSAFVLARELRSAPRDKTVVHVHHYRDGFTACLARILAKRPDVKIVSTRHSVRRGRDAYFFRKLYTAIDAHIFVSEMAFDRFYDTWEHHEFPIPKEKSFILHNSLYMPLDSPVSEPERGPVVALYHGPVVAGKGIETIIDALVRLRDIKMRLRITGPGNPDYLDSLRRRAMARGVMEMIDWNIGPNKAYLFIRESHFGLVPSIEREAFCFPSLRYMVFGRPQICTANGAQTEYLKNGHTALIIKPSDAAELAMAMRRLATDPELRRDMGKEAFREFAAHLSWQPFIKKLDKIYNI